MCTRHALRGVAFGLSKNMPFSVLAPSIKNKVLGEGGKLFFFSSHPVPRGVTTTDHNDGASYTLVELSFAWVPAGSHGPTGTHGHPWEPAGSPTGARGFPLEMPSDFPSDIPWDGTSHGFPRVLVGTPTLAPPREFLWELPRDHSRDIPWHIARIPAVYTRRCVCPGPD